jgi:hypothetical protein
MPVGVSYSLGGDVVVVDMDSGTRWDMSPEMATVAAEKLETAVGRGTSSAFVLCDCLEDRQFRWAGDRRDALKMAADLRDSANKAATVSGGAEEPAS